MPTLKAIRRRIASVKSTQQITRAMKLVAAARLRRAQEALLNARPYSEALARVADSVLGGAEQRFGPGEGAASAALVVAIASDRGLCGAYNANLLKMAEQQACELHAAGLETRFFAVGRKALDHFKSTGVKLVGDKVGNPRLATVGLARDLAHRMLGAYQSGEVCETGIVYSKFRSAISQRPIYQRLLPIDQVGAKTESGGGDRSPQPGALTDYLVEPGREELMKLVLRTYLEASVFHALLEAEASEHGARMTAMDNATNNASEAIERLTLEMNRARQAQITKELMDIVGGAEALRG